MKKYSAVSCISNVEIKATRYSLEQNNFTLYEFDGKGVVDFETFFYKIIKVLPQDPPLSGGRPHQDAFIDSISGAFYDVEIDKVAVIWYDADNICVNSPNDLLDIVDCFQSIANSLSKIKYGLKKPIDFRILLVGEKAKDLFE